MEQVVKEVMPGLSHTIAEAEARISFLIMNQHPALSGVVPTMPNVRNIAGVHLHPANPLPKDLEKFVDTPEGFIFVSFGTYFNPSEMTNETKQMLVDTFSQIPHQVIFKYKGQLPGLSSNVKLVDWAPQQDLLGHPKIRAFVAHGGIFGIQEALYHGVPVLGLPVFFDQFANMAKAEERGFAKTLNLEKITSDYLVASITDIINNKSYKENVLKYQAWFKDSPMHPVDESVYWIEYNIRHNGSYHLRSAADRLNILQYFVLDVIGFVLLLVVIGVFFVVKVISLGLRLVRKDQRKNKKD
jgi:glucuronosyltransferase